MKRKQFEKVSLLKGELSRINKQSCDQCYSAFLVSALIRFSQIKMLKSFSKQFVMVKS